VHGERGGNPVLAGYSHACYASKLTVEVDYIHLTCLDKTVQLSGRSSAEKKATQGMRHLIEIVPPGYRYLQSAIG
jgi:hypothetical protein